MYVILKQIVLMSTSYLKSDYIRGLSPPACKTTSKKKHFYLSSSRPMRTNEDGGKM